MKPKVKELEKKATSTAEAKEVAANRTKLFNVMEELRPYEERLEQIENILNSDEIKLAKSE